jgi:hypothetical protein
LTVYVLIQYMYLFKALSIVLICCLPNHCTPPTINTVLLLFSKGEVLQLLTKHVESVG